MRKIINGKRYDTETAELIHPWSNRRSRTDFRRRDKDLYRTPRGRWFLHHFGGPMTDCAERVGDNFGYGQQIEPVSEEDAYRFLESHGGEAVIETHFADRVEDA